MRSVPFGYRRLFLLPLIPLLTGPLSCDLGDASSGPPSSPVVARARELLAEAGYPEGKDFPETELLYNTNEINKRIAAALQYMWHRNLGVRVTLRNVEWKTYLDALSKLDYQIARRNWYGDYNDPNTFLEMFLKGGGNNNTGWASPEYDRLVHAAGKEPDRKRRQGFLEDAEALIIREAPIFPLYFRVTQELVSPRVEGWHPTPLSIHPLNRVRRTDGKTLVINNHQEVQTLDPARARGLVEMKVLLALQEGLLNYDPETLRPVPGVAEKWDLSPDGRTYTFHLRECRWSDGSPLTAGDFAYAWKRILTPETAADYAHQLFYIEGAEAYNMGKADAEAVAVRAVDDRTLTVRLNHPVAFFPDLMPFMSFHPVHRGTVEEHDNAWTLPENHVGNGPFRLASWVPHDHILLERNPEYWDTGNVLQQTVRFLPTENISTAFNLYESGECDILTEVPPDAVKQLRGRPDFITGPILATSFYSFNVTGKPFDDVRVRQAFSLAVERENLVKVARGGQKPARHFVPPLFPGFRHPDLEAEALR